MASADVEFRCFVGGLAWATTDQSLEQAFSQFGEILESKRDAIEGMNGQDLEGRNITVNEAQSRGSSDGVAYGGDRREGGYDGGDRGYGGGSRYSRGGGASDGNWRS